MLVNICVARRKSSSVSGLAANLGAGLQNTKAGCVILVVEKVSY